MIAYRNNKRLFLVGLGYRAGALLILAFVINVAAFAEGRNKQGKTTNKANFWKTFALDLDYAAVPSTSALFSSRLDLFRTTLTAYRVAVVRAEDFGKKALDVRSLCLLSGAAVCINANFFDERGAALGLVISKGIKFHDIHLGGSTLTGIFAATPKGLSIEHRNLFNSSEASEAVQAGPRLVSRGQIVPGLTANQSSARRSGVCIDSQKRLIIFCASDGFLGLSFSQLQTILTSPEIRCYDALNFDGGGSAQLFVSGNLPKRKLSSDEIFAPGRDPVPVAIALFRRDAVKSRP